MFKQQWNWIKKSWTMWLAVGVAALPFIDGVVSVLPDDMKNSTGFLVLSIAMVLLRVKTELQK